MKYKILRRFGINPLSSVTDNSMGKIVNIKYDAWINGEKWQGVGVVLKKAKYMENSRGEGKKKEKCM